MSKCSRKILEKLAKVYRKVYSLPKCIKDTTSIVGSNRAGTHLFKYGCLKLSSFK